MLKRMFAVVLCAVLILTFISCGKSDDNKSDAPGENKTESVNTPDEANQMYEDYISAMTATNEAPTYELTLHETMKSTEKESEMTAVRVADLTDAASPSIFYTVTTSQNDEVVVDQLCYYKEGIFYYNDLSNQYQTEMDASGIVDDYIGPVKSMGIAEAAFLAAEKKPVDDELYNELIYGARTDGGYIIKFAKGDRNLDDFAMQFVGTNISGVDNADLTVGINEKGELFLINFSFEAEYGDSGTTKVDIKFEFKTIGGAVDIVEPEGVRDYPVNENDPNLEMSNEDAEAIYAAFALFDRDNNYEKVANYDELYKAACDKYGKDTMDSLIETILAIASVSDGADTDA